MSLPHTPGAWTLVTFTDSAAHVAELAELRDRHPSFRAVAVVPVSVEAPAGVAVLVDVGGALAASLGIRGTHTWIVDGRGTCTHGWAGLPEGEAVAVFAARSPLPSGAPPWLFPVLAAAVVLGGIAAWAWTHAPQAPVAAVLPAVTPAAPVEAAPAPDAGEAADAMDDEEGDEAEGKVGKAGKAGKAPKGGKARENKLGGWTVAPREKARQVAKLSGADLTIEALADQTVTACHDPEPLSGATRVEAEWKLDGVAAKGARAFVRQRDAAGKPIKEPAARTVLGRGGGTAAWATIGADITPLAGAATYTYCVDLEKGTGSATLRAPH